MVDIHSKPTSNTQKNIQSDERLNNLQHSSQVTPISSSNAPVDTSEAKLNEEELNQELGIYIPNETLTEMIPVWYSMLTTLRQGYVNEVLNKEQVTHIFKKFFQISDTKKNEAVAKITEEIHKSEELASKIDAVWQVEELREEYEEFLAQFPQDVQERIQIFVQTGQDVGDIKELIDYKTSLMSAQQQQRLVQVFQGRAGGFRIDSNDTDRASYAIRDRGENSSSVLDLDELEQRYGDELEQNQATIPQPSSLPQPVAPVPKPRNSSIVSQQLESNRVTLPPKAPTQPTKQGQTVNNGNQTKSPSEVTRPAVPGSKPKPLNGLDELLNK